MIEVREPKSFEAMKFPTMISFSFIYMQNFTDLLSVHLTNPVINLIFPSSKFKGSKNTSPLAETSAEKYRSDIIFDFVVVE